MCVKHVRWDFRDEIAYFDINEFTEKEKGAMPAICVISGSFAKII